MQVIPAIDLRRGSVVRLTQGNFEREMIFSRNPEEVALKFERLGAKLIHVVDLDGARAGQMQNLDSIKKILDAVKIPIELGGGLRDLVNIEKVLSLGVSRVIVGSAAVKNPVLIKQVCKLHGGDKIVVGIDVKNGKVAIDGWEKSVDTSPVELAKRMKSFGVKTIIFTDIARDGMQEGVNIDATVEFAKATGMKIIASGGVSTTEDIQNIKPFEKYIDGVIVGKALYSGDFDFKAAVRTAESFQLFGESHAS